MPFEPPYASQYTKGDLFYGLAEPRDRLLEKLIPNHKLTVHGHRTTTIDTLFLNLAYLEDPDMAGPEEFSNTVRGFVASVAKHQKFRSAIDEEGSGNQNIRRKCKGGLHWASETNRTVHFCLDEIDMFAVVNKTVADEAKGAFDIPLGRKANMGEEKKRVYTNSELR